MLENPCWGGGGGGEDRAAEGERGGCTGASTGQGSREAFYGDGAFPEDSGVLKDYKTLMLEVVTL